MYHLLTEQLTRQRELIVVVDEYLGVAVHLASARTTFYRLDPLLLVLPWRCRY